MKRIPICANVSPEVKDLLSKKNLETGIPKGILIEHALTNLYAWRHPTCKECLKENCTMKKSDEFYCAEWEG